MLKYINVNRQVIFFLSIMVVLGVSGEASAGWSHRHNARETVNNPNYGDMMRLRDAYVQQAADFRRTIATHKENLTVALAMENVNQETVTAIEHKIASIRMEMASAKQQHVLAMKNRGKDYAAFCSAGGHSNETPQTGGVHRTSHDAGHNK